MDRVAVFVDAGYLFAQGSASLAGRKLPRGDLDFTPAAARAAIRDLAERISGLPLLRIYWYDGTATSPTSTHIALAELADVKLRLGFVNSIGEQKGVDSLIVTDMINLARNGAMTDAVLLSGDEDLRVGVQQAQEFGVRVHLVGIEPARGSQSLFLLQEADMTIEWKAEDLRGFLKVKTVPSAPSASILPHPLSISPAKMSVDPVIRLVAAEVANAVPDADLAAVVHEFEATRQMPKETDKRLLGTCYAKLGRLLDSAEKKIVRREFISACKDRIAK